MVVVVYNKENGETSCFLYSETNVHLFWLNFSPSTWTMELFRLPFVGEI